MYRQRTCTLLYTCVCESVCVYECGLQHEFSSESDTKGITPIPFLKSNYVSLWRPIYLFVENDQYAFVNRMTMEQQLRMFEKVL